MEIERSPHLFHRRPLGGITRAADAPHRAVNVTQRVKALEAEIGTALSNGTAAA